MLATDERCSSWFGRKARSMRLRAVFCPAVWDFSREKITREHHAGVIPENLPGRSVDRIVEPETEENRTRSSGLDPQPDANMVSAIPTIRIVPSTPIEHLPKRLKFS